MNRGQFEIMGIAIIIAILTLGGLIFFVISQSREENAVKEYSNTEFAQGYLEVLLKTTACKGYAVNELLKDCASDKAISCADGSSCEKARDVAKETLEKTLLTYNKEYIFRAAKTDGGQETSLFELQSGNPCIEKDRPGRQPLPNNVILTLEICDKR